MRTILLLLASAALSFGAALNGPITADGTYTVTTVTGQRYVFAASGDFGSGSLAIKWNDGTTSTAYSNSPASAAETWTFTAASNQVDLVLTGASDPSIAISITLATGSAGGSVESIADVPGLQTALDAKIPSGPLQVACVGTSITFQGTSLETTAVPRLVDQCGGHAGWLEHLSNHKIRLVRRNGVAETNTDKTFGYSGFQLPGLTNGAGGVYPLDNAIASGAEVLVLEGGTNDITAGSATVISRITSYWTKAAESGIKCVALNVLPTGGVITTAGSFVTGHSYQIYTAGTTDYTLIGAADSNVGTFFTATGAGTGTGTAISKSSTTATTTRDTIATVNAALPAIATSLGITLIDVHALAEKVDGFGTLNSINDSVHPSPSYAKNMAEAILAELATAYQNRAQEMIVPAAASALWVTTDNSPSGATKPASWAKSGTFTDTYTAISDTDGTTWQRVRMQQGGTAGSANSLYIRVSSGFSPGDRIRFCIRIRAVDGATTNIRSIRFFMRTSVAYSSWTNCAAIEGGSTASSGMDGFSGLFVSPEYTVPASHAAMDAFLEIYNESDATFDIRQFGVFRVVTNL